jgi:hypothetical protein
VLSLSHNCDFGSERVNPFSALLRFLIDFYFFEHLYSTHIHSSNAHGANVLACSQKVSDSEMRLVSAVIGALFPFFPF